MEAVDFRGFDWAEVVLFVGFLGGEDAEVHFHGLEVAEVDGGGGRCVVHEVASGVLGLPRDFISNAHWV